MRRHAYLAGPEVFLSEPHRSEVAHAKRALCERHGFEAIQPGDTAVDLSGLAPLEQAWRIAQVNEALIRRCDLLVANASPFRGWSMDVGTAYEIGFMRALGRPVFAYTNDPASLAARTQRALALGNALRDTDRLAIESFGGTENAMIEGALHDSGAEFVTAPRAITGDSAFRDLEAFGRCLEHAAEVLARTG